MVAIDTTPTLEEQLAEARSLAKEVLKAYDEARAQIAAKDAALRQSLQHRDTLRSDLAEARAQIAAKDAALNALDEAHQITQQNLWQDITELRASLVGKEQEHQDFRLQNDAEWRAKLDHLKAQIAAKDAALLQVLASLVATTSLIIRAEDMKVKPSKAVASDTMFTQMLKDYDNATIAGRAALEKING